MRINAFIPRSWRVANQAGRGPAVSNTLSQQYHPPGFAAWSSPEWVVISSGGNDQVEPVIRTYEHVGAHVLVTSDVGLIQLKVHPDSCFQVNSWRVPCRSDVARAERP
jgi:hypothetical protein